MLKSKNSPASTLQPVPSPVTFQPYVCESTKNRVPAGQFNVLRTPIHNVSVNGNQWKKKRNSRWLWRSIHEIRGIKPSTSQIQWYSFLVQFWENTSIQYCVKKYNAHIWCTRLCTNAQWVGTEGNRRIQFMSSRVCERASERMNERSGARERSKQCGASEWLSGVSKWANGGVNSSVIHASTSWSFYP